ncbi:MAG: PAS domain-containing protein [Thalassobaculum sp.]|uniref:PAS domain-containing protein n=1 Tax=Thalassobaculum sp. TaxID=2022740 RepID=UPI0032EB8206
MKDDGNRTPGPAGAGWRRPPIEERADQVRTWTPLAVDELHHPALRALAEAWLLASADEGVRPPSRIAFRPTDVVSALGRITVLERTAGADGTGHSWKYRLVGTEIATLVDADVTGQVIDRFHAPLAAMLRAQFDGASESGDPAAFVVRTVVDHRPYAYEKIVLPVRSAPGAGVDQVVVASFPMEPP